MLRITMCKSASGASKYFFEDYYNDGEKGKWRGLAAEKLGLEGHIHKSDFAALLDNKRPDNGKPLTGRTNDNRRVGYDFTFSANKSVSIVHALGSKEDKILIEKAFSDSVITTLKELEKNMQARVRDNGKDEDRITGNIAYGMFTHHTTRPIDGIADPHLHAHCFIVNATHDKKGDKWKAAQFGQIAQDAPYYQAYFHAQMAQNLQKAGFETEQGKLGIEIKGISQEIRDSYSRRTIKINEFAEEHDITNEKARSEIGARTREQKRTSVSDKEQQINWVNRLTPQELHDIQHIRKAKPETNDEPIEKEYTKAKEAVAYSLDHHLERKSVISDKELLATAMKFSYGKVTPEQVKEALKERKDVLQVNDKQRTLLTTKDALDEERLLIRNAVSSRGNMPAINKDYKPKGEQLTKEQKEAIKHSLSTYDSLVVITGKAGVGKTTLMKEIKIGVLAAGKQIHAYAPSADASRGVQRTEGFQNADTVASLIKNTDKQPQLKNQVIWVDEAGLLSNKQANAIFKIAKEQDAKLIFSGDVNQHKSVDRGDALRNILVHAKFKSVTVSKIQRQQNRDYKEAVHHLSKGDVDKGFDKLHNMGAIHEVDDHQQRAAMVAKDYYNSIDKAKPSKNNVLVVVPTHAEGNMITREIRAKLKEEGIVGKRDKQYKVLQNLQFTKAEKGNIDNYSKGQHLVFHQNIKQVTKGNRLEVVGKKEDMLWGKSQDGKTYKVPLTTAKHFNVFEEHDIAIAKGDKIRVTNNQKNTDGKTLRNGTMHTIMGFTKDGEIKLSSGSTISKEFKHFKLGYVSTSHSAQGKTVDKVIISQSSMSRAAASMEQFYVSVSRGRKAVAIYTDNKADLLAAVQQSNQRMSGKELYAKAPLLQKVNFNGRLMIQKARDNAVQKHQQTRNAINRHHARIQASIKPPPAPPRGRGR